MSWEKFNTFRALDSEAIADGRPASAHVLRVLAKSANYLGAAPRDLLSVAAGLEGPEVLFALDPQLRRLNTWPIMKPRGVTRATIRLRGSWATGSDLTAQFTTSRGVYTGSPKTSAGGSEVILVEGVEFAPGGVDYLDVHLSSPDGDVAAGGGGGTPISGNVTDLSVTGDNGARLTLASSASPNWTVGASSFGAYACALFLYDAEGAVAASPSIQTVLTTDTIMIAPPLRWMPRADGSLGPAVGVTWEVRVPHRFTFQSLLVTSDEVGA